MGRSADPHEVRLPSGQGYRKPLNALSVTPEPAESTAYGQTVSNLQENISIAADGTVSGKLKYVSNYTGFSKTNNSGNFLAMKVEYPEDAEVAVTVEGGSTKNKKLPKGDHLLVAKISATTQKIKLDITKGGETATKTFAMSGLTLDPAPVV